MPENAQTPDADLQRIRVIGNELVKIHDGIRQELTAARKEVDAVLGGTATAPGTGRPAPDLGVELRRRCLSVCGTLHEHHSNEDSRGFPLLERQFPELRPALDRLREEHVVVARITSDIEALLDERGTGDPEQVRAGFEQLASELETHFTYEEEQLVGALNKLDAAALRPEDLPPEH